MTVVRVTRDRQAWACIRPEDIADECSPAHIANILRDAQHDLLALFDAIKSHNVDVLARIPATSQEQKP